ncbi:hypothetical protein RND81_05G152400 [Saponaria officinalis]|uniref:S-protein homolog n=1 Tax=Saponaria officinalis TaxID=3572 RepID=A0AAW1KSK5_SAPOF
MEGKANNHTRRALSGLYPKTHIQFQNQLGDGISQVLIHCKDVNYGDDKGDQIVDDAQVYEFRFTPNPFYYPVFYCHFSSRNGVINEKVYNYRRDYKRCFKHCNYIIHNDAFYGINGNGDADLIWLWKPPPKMI